MPTDPRVSTAGSFLIMVLTLTMRATPRARTMVTTAGRPSGMAATAREMATRSICRMLRCWTTPRRKRAAQRTTATTLNIFPRSPKRLCRGVSSVGVSLIIPAILPSSVSMPVATTIPSALPFMASVDINAMFFHSAIGIPWGSTVSVFRTGMDSPVRADSLVWKPCTLIRRISAGTWSPASILTRSPGTTPEAGIFL